MVVVQKKCRVRWKVISRRGGVLDMARLENLRSVGTGCEIGSGGGGCWLVKSLRKVREGKWAWRIKVVNRLQNAEVD